MPRNTKSRYNNDCTPQGVIRRATEVYKMSNVKNPIKTDNFVVDLFVGKILWQKTGIKGLMLENLDL